MNDSIANLTLQRMQDAQITGAALSRALGMSESTISRTLTGAVGKPSAAWTAILELLGLELTVIPRKSLADIQLDVKAAELEGVGKRAKQENLSRAEYETLMREIGVPQEMLDVIEANAGKDPHKAVSALRQFAREKLAEQEAASEKHPKQ